MDLESKLLVKHKWNLRVWLKRIFIVIQLIGSHAFSCAILGINCTWTHYAHGITSACCLHNYSQIAIERVWFPPFPSQVVRIVYTNSTHCTAWSYAGTAACWYWLKHCRWSHRYISSLGCDRLFFRIHSSDHPFQTINCVIHGLGLGDLSSKFYRRSEIENENEMRLLTWQCKL